MPRNRLSQATIRRIKELRETTDLTHGQIAKLTGVKKFTVRYHLTPKKKRRGGFYQPPKPLGGLTPPDMESAPIWCDGCRAWVHGPKCYLCQVCEWKKEHGKKHRKSGRMIE